MFYSHEILTSRRYGVATVWLIATLGSRPSTRKVTKKEILNVDVSKACNVIIAPPGPLALRLQSNLLAGVCRVHAQQATYLLTDVQNVQGDMRRLFRAIRRDDQHIDMEAGRNVRPDQLLLPDDPNFLPAMLGLDNLPSLELDLTEPSSRTESVLSPHSKRSSQSSFGQAPEIQIPSSSHGGGGMDFGPMFSESVSGIGKGAHERSEQHIDDDALLPEPGFTLDADDDPFNLAEHETIPTPPLMSPLQRGSHAPSVASAQVASHAAQDEQRDDAVAANFDLPSDDFIQDDSVPAHQPSPHAPPNSEQHPASTTSHHTPSSPSTVAAPQRRKRHPKAIPLDRRTQLGNTDLLAWRNDYLSAQSKATEKRLALKATSLAKKNAWWYTFGGGIGGVGIEVVRFGPEHPLAIFQGQSLHAILTGLDSDASKKRHRNDEEEDRRVRPRSEEAGLPDDNDAPMFDADEDRAIEAGRAAPTPPPGPPSADDDGSTMPWNVSALRVSSHDSLKGMQPSRLSAQLARLEAGRARSRSRLTSASPLLGRGRLSRTGSLLRDLPAGVSSDSPGGGVGGWSGGDLGGDLGDFEDENGEGEMGNDTQYELFGPAAAVDTQTAGSSQFIRRALDTEALHFAEFLSASLSTTGTDRDHRWVHRTPSDVADADSAGAPAGNRFVRSIMFDQLLPPGENNHVVAAQGLLHALTLASRGVAWIRQWGWDRGKGEGEGEWVFDGEIYMGLYGFEGARDEEDDEGDGDSEEDDKGAGGSQQG